ncbi:hypothetical protein CGJ47_06475 [Vibrio parahaemolyticus]|nr:hypothetical protein CGJ47_06475 [Vibrio parahaemolyticus]TOI41766.1 hypothetical protein CGI60_19245 [Vibrio parahaemolyticus]
MVFHTFLVVYLSANTKSNVEFSIYTKNMHKFWYRCRKCRMQPPFNQFVSILFVQEPVST